MRPSLLPWLVIATLVAGGAWATETDSVPLAELGKPGRVLMLRHANAPGTGDPPEFRLDDCATQRNLDAAGRAQAAALAQGWHRPALRAPKSIPASGAAASKPRACSNSVASRRCPR